MKRAEAKRAPKVSKTRLSGGKAQERPSDLASIRERITNLVSNEALNMVQITIEEVNKGHYMAMKYLFEMIGLYPGAAKEEAPVEDSLARTLLRRLGLPEEPMLESSVTKDRVVGQQAPKEDTVK
ncbi:MAG: hypothetical protein M3O09_06875 [Acidobacteriota bacterium]|nr:hypothetical protein [Acidobacteriota bacterium]